MPWILASKADVYASVHSWAVSTLGWLNRYLECGVLPYGLTG